MTPENNDINQILSKPWIGKENFLKLIDVNPSYLEELLLICQTDEKPQAWRAAWLIRHAMLQNDPRVAPRISEILSVLRKKEDGHQRELLLILDQMKLSDEIYGSLFDECCRIWEAVSKKSSTRVTAMKLMLRIAGNHPELLNEIKLLTQDHYTDSLSPGIKKMLFRMLEEN